MLVQNFTNKTRVLLIQQPFSLESTASQNYLPSIKLAGAVAVPTGTSEVYSSVPVGLSIEFERLILFGGMAQLWTSYD